MALLFSLQEHDFTVTVHHGHDIPKVLRKKPSMVVKDPGLAVPGCDIIFITVPAFAHEQYLAALKPHVKPGVILVGLPGQAGFEFAVRGIWGELAKECTIMAFESLPWACRTTEFGKHVEILGIKSHLPGAIHMGHTPPSGDPCAMLQKAIGDTPEMTESGHLLGITLMATNGYLHPSIMYGYWRDWDGKPLAEPPLFYNGLNQLGAETLSAASDEIVATAKAIMKQRPSVDLNNVTHIYDWYLLCYGDQIEDKTNLYSCIHTNEAYEGLTHPMIKQEDGQYMPNFKYRYLTEDISYGLLPMKGVAQVAGVATPTIDKIIRWAEQRLGCQYLVDDKLEGKDCGSSRSPQKYNLTGLDSILGIY